MRKLYACISLFFFFVAGLYSQVNVDASQLNQQAESKLNQNPKEAISLATEAKSKAEQSEDKKNGALATILIGVANFKIDNYDRARILLTDALSRSENCGDSATLAYAYYWNGNSEVNKGEYAKALEHYEMARDISVKIKESKNLARSLDGLGGIYEILNEDDKALSYYNESLKIATETNFKEWIPAVLSSLGNLALKKKSTEEAIAKFQESVSKSEQVGNLNNKANCLQQLASIYYDKNKRKEAMTYVQQAMELFQQTGAMTSYSRSRLLMSLILLGDNQFDLAVDLAKSSLREGKEKNDIALQKDACEVLYYSFFNKGDKSKALDFHIQFYELSQRNQSEELAKKLTQMELKDKFEKEKVIASVQQEKQRVEMNGQIEKQKFVKKASFIGLGLLAVIAGLAFFAFIQNRNDSRLIAAEKKKSDDLLFNILPEEVINELKEIGKSKDRNNQMATVLFADIKNFTGAAESMPPQKLADEIDFYFNKFDEIVERHKMERVKTNDDVYLCVAGQLVGDRDNASHVVSAAIEMQTWVRQIRDDRKDRGQTYFEISVGIHSGPLLAGIVGLRKFTYDIWGETVNAAARMEQHGEAGRINISDATFELVKDKFLCTFRGKVDTKNKGHIDMYFVEGVV